MRGKGIQMDGSRNEGRRDHIYSLRLIDVERESLNKYAQEHHLLPAEVVRIAVRDLIEKKVEKLESRVIYLEKYLIDKTKMGDLPRIINEIETSEGKDHLLEAFNRKENQE